MRALGRRWQPFVRRHATVLWLCGAFLGGDFVGSALMLRLDTATRTQLIGMAQSFWGARLRQSYGESTASSLLLGSLLLTVLFLAGCSTIAPLVVYPALFIRGLSFGVTACALYCATEKLLPPLQLALPAFLSCLLLTAAASQALMRSRALCAALQKSGHAAPAGWSFPLTMAGLYLGQLVLSVMEGLLFAGIGGV